MGYLLSTRALSGKAWIRRVVASCIATAVLCFALPALATYIVGAGATTSLNAGRLDLSCTDLIVAGTLNVNSAAIVNVRDVIVQPGGILHGGAGSITLSRNFTVAAGGQFLAEQGTVNYNTNCGPGLPQSIPENIPALGNEMLIALAALLMGLPMLVLGDGRMQRRRNTTKGVKQ